MRPRVLPVRRRRGRLSASLGGARSAAISADDDSLAYVPDVPTFVLPRETRRFGAPYASFVSMKTMKAVVFRGKDRLAVEEVPKPRPKAGEAVIRITTTTICGTDVHIVRGEYPVEPGLILGHEPVGVIEELGAGLEDLYAVGQRVIVGAITPCGQCFYCLNGSHAQCGGALGGWRFGNTINGAWAEYLLVPDARANLAPIPTGLTDEDVLLCPDIFSTGLAGAESGNIRVGDSVAVFAQGPIGLCATVGARLKGASLIIGIDAMGERLEVARRFGANVTLNINNGDPVPEIKRLTEGRGVDVAIEALGRQETFESALRAIRPGGTLSSLGVYSGKIVAPYDAFYAGLGDQKIVTTLCPGGKERMRRLMAMIENRRVDLTPLVTHRFTLDDIEEAFDLFSHQRDGVLKVALYPGLAHSRPVLEAAGVGRLDEQC
jgi:threonine dehydrogenase-like Zn-dependent dehydrogenase